MDAGRSSQPSSMRNRMSLERKSERELVVTRTINAPPRIVFEAWTKAELFQRWWVPKSLGLTLLSCELDVRVGGTYRLVFRHPAAPEGMAFHGRYLEVTPPSRLVWTNEEAGGTGQVTTVTFEERAGQTLVHEGEVALSRLCSPCETSGSAMTARARIFMGQQRTSNAEDGRGLPGHFV